MAQPGVPGWLPPAAYGTNAAAMIMALLKNKQNQQQASLGGQATAHPTAPSQPSVPPSSGDPIGGSPLGASPQTQPSNGPVPAAIATSGIPSQPPAMSGPYGAMPGSLGSIGMGGGGVGPSRAMPQNPFGSSVGVPSEAGGPQGANPMMQAAIMQQLMKYANPNKGLNPWENKGGGIMGSSPSNMGP